MKSLKESIFKPETCQLTFLLVKMIIPLTFILTGDRSIYSTKIIVV